MRIHDVVVNTPKFLDAPTTHPVANEQHLTLFQGWVQPSGRVNIPRGIFRWCRTRWRISRRRQKNAKAAISQGNDKVIGYIVRRSYKSFCLRDEENEGQPHLRQQPAWHHHYVLQFLKTVFNKQAHCTLHIHKISEYGTHKQ